MGLSPNYKEISDNTFSGPFAAATQFQEDNSVMQLNCNVYTNNPRIDWYIASGTLERQGDCLGVTEEANALKWYHSKA